MNVLRAMVDAITLVLIRKEVISVNVWMGSL